MKKILLKMKAELSRIRYPDVKVGYEKHIIIVKVPGRFYMILNL